MRSMRSDLVSVRPIATLVLSSFGVQVVCILCMCDCASSENVRLCAIAFRRLCAQGLLKHVLLGGLQGVGPYMHGCTK